MTLKELQKRVIITDSCQSEMVNVEILYRGKKYTCTTYDNTYRCGTRKQKLQDYYDYCKILNNLGNCTKWIDENGKVH